MAKKAESTLLNMVLVLTIIAVVTAAALAFLNNVTKGPIADAKKAKTEAAIKEVLRRREGLDIGSVRPPLAAYTAEDDAAIAHAVSLIDLAMKRWVG